MSPNAYTDYLTPNTSFLIGMGSCLNIAGNYYLYNASQTPEDSDARAICSDWKMVGFDLRTAMSELPAL